MSLSTEPVAPTYTREEILEHRREWLAALRDPNRKQVVGRLCHLNPNDRAIVGECCPGVAASVAGVEFVDHGRMRSFVSVGVLNSPSTTNSALPYAARAWLGLDLKGDFPQLTESQSLPDDGSGIEDMESSLAGLNDGGFTFAQIADLIEEFGIKNDPNANLGWS